MNSLLERTSFLLLLVLIACLSFEIRPAPSYPSQLQIVFAGLFVLSLPGLIRDRRVLFSHPAVVTAVLFAATTWIAAFTSSGFLENAVKGAVRYSAGVALMCIALRSKNFQQMHKLWALAAAAAAVYGVADYYGFGFPRLFRDMEFYFEDVKRLSGSFEYPNVAAAYFAMSLPVVWSVPYGKAFRIATSAALWVALILTFSRGAAVAVVLVVLLWAFVSRSYRPLELLLIGALAYAGLSAYHPLFERVVGMKPRKPLDVEYSLIHNQIRERNAVIGEMPVTLRNPGRETWASRGSNRVTLSYHWYDTIKKEILNVRALETELPHDVKPNESVTVIAEFKTPDADGFYLLDWDLKQLPDTWFALGSGVPPGVVEADIRHDATTWSGFGDVGRWYKPSRNTGPRAAADIPRYQLWRAAWLIAETHPILGVGPDNYRLMYGKVLGFADWDSHIRTNNLYLEILVGCGAMGLGAFLLLLSRLPWQLSPPFLALAVALLHGLFDFFLMTTPIYFGFWILMGAGSAIAGSEVLQASKESE